MTITGALAFCCFVIAAIGLIGGIGELAVLLGIISIGLALLCLAGLGRKVIG